MSEATVLTSENSAEFYAKRLNLAPEVIIATPTDEAKVVEKPTENAGDKDKKVVIEEPLESTLTPEEIAAKEAEKLETAQQEAKEKEAQEATNKEETDKKAEQDRKSGLNARMKELVDQRNVERARAEAAERRAAELEAKFNPAKDNGEPKPEQFQDGIEYAKALAEWSVENALRAKEIEDAQRGVKQRQEALLGDWKKRVDSTRKEIEDYDMTIEASPIVVSDAVRDAIVESDVGPKILYHLAQNPEFGEKLSKLSPASQVREIGKLEATLTPKTVEKTVEVADTIKTPTAVVSKAPAPISPLKGANAPVEPPINSAGEYVGTYADWKKMRKAGKIS